MSAVQRVFTAILPRRWAQAVEAESRAWLVACPCGCSRSVWEMGGIRFKAPGEPLRLMRCPRCHEASWHSIYRSGL